MRTCHRKQGRSYRRWAGPKDSSWQRSARRDRQNFDCATWLHKAHELSKEDFQQAVERELTGKITEPWEIVYFKLYESQVPVIDRALETAALMLGSDRSRGYCLEMICADFLAGANLDNGDPETLLFSMTRFFRLLPENQKQTFLESLTRKHHERDSLKIRALSARSHLIRESAATRPTARRLALSVLRSDDEPGSPSSTVSQPLRRRLRTEPNYALLGLSHGYSSVPCQLSKCCGCQAKTGKQARIFGIIDSGSPHPQRVNPPGYFNIARAWIACSISNLIETRLLYE